MSALIPLSPVSAEPRPAPAGTLSVAIVRARYNPFGGAERFVQRALAALSSKPLSLTVLARRWQRDGGDGDAMPANVRWLRLDPFHVGRLWRDVSFARAVQRHLAAHPYDLVQSHERIPGVTIYRAGDGVHAEYLAQQARVMGAPPRWRQALRWHDRWLLRTERQMFEHPALRVVICNSRMVRDEIARRFAIDPSRLRLVRNGVDLQRFSPPTPVQRQAARLELGLTATEPILAFVGAGFQRKGLDAALRALADPRVSTEVRLLVAGTDKHAMRYRRLAGSLGLAGRVVFLGGVKDVVPVLHAADGFVLPTLYDPFPNAVLEALACGLPTVTTFQCGAAEFVEDGVNGQVADAADHRAIAAGLMAILDPVRHAAMRVAARASVATLSSAALGDDLLALYRELAATDRAAATA